MDELHKRRWIGAAIIVGIVAVLAWLLPSPHLQPKPEDGEQLVTISLADSTITYDPPLPTATPEPVLPDEDEADAEVPEPVSVATPESTAKPTVRPTARPTPAPTVKPTAAPTLRPTPVSTPVQTPAPTPVTTAAAQAERWWVQIGSFGDANNARDVEIRLKSLGLAVVLAPIEVGSATLYRVRSGPYPSEAAAQQAQATVVGAGYAGAQLVRP